MKRQLLVYSVVVSFNRHYDAHWMVRAPSAQAARRAALRATRQHKGIRRDVKWYAQNYEAGRRYSMKYATARVWKEKETELQREWDVSPRRITTKPYMYSSGT